MVVWKGEFFQITNSQNNLLKIKKVQTNDILNKLFIRIVNFKKSQIITVAFYNINIHVLKYNNDTRN